MHPARDDAPFLTAIRAQERLHRLWTQALRSLSWIDSTGEAAIEDQLPVHSRSSMIHGAPFESFRVTRLRLREAHHLIGLAASPVTERRAMTTVDDRPSTARDEDVIAAIVAPEAVPRSLPSTSLQARPLVARCSAESTAIPELQPHALATRKTPTEPPDACIVRNVDLRVAISFMSTTKRRAPFPRSHYSCLIPWRRSCSSAERRMRGHGALRHRPPRHERCVRMLLIVLGCANPRAPSEPGRDAGRASPDPSMRLPLDDPEMALHLDLEGLSRTKVPSAKPAPTTDFDA